MPSCFLCGADGRVRQVEVVTSSRTTHFDDGLVHHASHHHHHSHSQTTRVTELKPLCEPCIAKQEAEARAQLEVVKKAAVVGAVGVGLFGVTGVMIAVMPIVLGALCLVGFAAAKYLQLLD